MPTANQQLAALFAQMADILEILESDRFRVNAFRKTSRVLDDMAEDVAGIGPDISSLVQIDGVGKGAAQRIAEFLETGKIADHTQLMDQIPDGLLGLLNISGLGPKTISLFWNQAGVEGLDDLKAKLETGELTNLPGLGKKKLENIQKSVAFAESAGGRVRLGQAMPMAFWFVGQLEKLKQVKQAAYAGSLRRGRETIGDIDVIVSAEAKGAAAISDAFVALEPVTDVLVKGATKSSVRTRGGMQVDLRVVEPRQYGAALMYFTGSKEHNIVLRQRAIDRGMNLNEYALTKGNKIIAGQTEQEIYQVLDLAWIPPELREDRGEMILAEKNELPKLIEIGDIKAELHAHTTASDGHWSIEEYAAAAAHRGFHTVAVTDHSRGQGQANGLSSQRLEQHIKNVRVAAAQMKNQITILAGSEVDILANGQLDYPDSLLKELDLVVASPHAALTQEPKKATDRLLKAIDNPYVTIMGHPTGRIILSREGLNPDMKQLIAAAAQRGIALELNANTMRLDLRDTHARMAIEAGVLLSINTDAHGPDHLDQLVYGVLTARRAGATKAGVINCLSKAALAKWLRGTRP